MKGEVLGFCFFIFFNFSIFICTGRKLCLPLERNKEEEVCNKFNFLSSATVH